MTSSGSSLTSLPRTPLLRLRSPADIAEVVPYLIGFHPSGSMVLLSLRGPRHRLRLALRVDLPADGGEAAFAAYAARRLANDGARRAVLVVYPAAGVPPGVTAHAALVAAVRGELEQCGIGVAEALCVGRGRWWSYACSSAACCPAEGTPVPPGPDGSATVVSATAAFAGLTALPDRQALADTLRPIDLLAARAMEQEFVRVEQRLCAGQATAEPVGEALAAESIELLRGAVERFGGGDTKLRDTEVARLVLGLHDTNVRDAVLPWVRGAEGDAAFAVWQELARRSVPPFDVVPLTLVAWAAWHRGAGTLAGIAVERARERDPGYSLAALIEQGLDRGVDPKRLRRLMLTKHRSRQRSRP
jgi:Domain of unknown function (DUF4192)